MGGGLRVVGAAEHNLRDVDVTFGPGLTAVVGVSGSGKSSLAFDVVYAEARRRLVESLSLGRVGDTMPAAHVRSIEGIGPAVAVSQDALNRNPSSTVATSVGLHPFLRILFARFAEVACPRCGIGVRAVSTEERLAVAMEALRDTGGLDVDVAIVRGLAGSHRRLLAGLRDRFRVVTVDGATWTTTDPVPDLDPDATHDVEVRAATVAGGATAAQVRAVLDEADGLGCPELRLGGIPVLRAPICPGCGDPVPRLDTAAFGVGGPDTSSHRVAGVALDQLLARSVGEVLAFVEALPVGLRAARVQDELVRRLRPLVDLGLGHLALDRSMPTLSRGEAQRTRLAVVLSGRLEDLLHVLDEPTIGLHHTDLARLLDAIASLPGPVLMVEHDPVAVAMADEVVEIGPGGGTGGGRLVFQGTPAELWEADTASGRGFSTAGVRVRARRAPGEGRIRIDGAHLRNLRGVSCAIPIGLLTAVTGPSGAGKSTLARDVLLASVRARSAVGCDGFAAPALRILQVDQSPLGKNPRSNPATYTKAFDRIRDVFASATGRSPSLFTFNRAEGACPTCEGMGAVELALPYLAPVWITCETCDGIRYRPEVLEATWEGRTVVDVLASSVDEARGVFAGHPKVLRTLDALAAVGLGYVRLGQPSPSLSGGEAQRVRLATELARARPGDLVVLDEPTTGLHPADLGRLIDVLDRLTGRGCTVVVVEHQADVIASADWQVDLGPGGGPDGGRLVHCGPPVADERPPVRPRTEARARRRSADLISVRGARAHNLRGVDVDIPKGRFTAVTGVSGSGKSSLVHDVVAAEATRRLLECLSVYERQSVREGPEAPVDSLTGLGPTIVIDSSTGISDRIAAALATVGRSSGLAVLVAVVLARAGTRRCTACGADEVRRTSALPEAAWACTACRASAVAIEPRHLVGSAISVCPGCLGLGVESRFVPERAIKRPDAPICAGCFGSGGLVGYFCDPHLNGSQSMRAFADRHGFDPRTTPWSELSADTQHQFLFGDPEPYPIVVDEDGRRQSVAWGFGDSGTTWRWKGLDPWMSGPGARGGGASDVIVCTTCEGRRLRPPYLTVRLGGRDRNDLFSGDLADLAETLDALPVPDDDIAAGARSTALRRLAFLRAVGLGYLHLDRTTWTLSAGEAQRIKLASVLGAALVDMTVLLDEPSRGLHPSEVDALAQTLTELRDAGNTVIAVEHDPTIVTAADHVVEIGPGAGPDGGRVVAWRRPSPRVVARRARRQPTGWMTVRGAREHNLRHLDVRIPLGVRVGVCGVSGSGKSSLVVDTIAHALAPPRPGPGGVARRLQAGVHDAIDGAPSRVVVADQSRAAIASPGMFLGIIDAVRAGFAGSEPALEQGITRQDLVYGCDGCKGQGSWQEGMWFLPSVARACDACGGTGYRREVADLEWRGRTLADLEGLTVGQLVDECGDLDAVARVGAAAADLGVAYLQVRQPGWSLSGGEAQRLKLAKELARRTRAAALYLLDEPTVGLHARDVDVLAVALDAVVDRGNTVVVVEHDPALLASCDWVIEIGPGAGPAGGTLVFEGTPDDLADASTATAPYVRSVLA